MKDGSAIRAHSSRGAVQNLSLGGLNWENDVERFPCVPEERPGERGRYARRN